ncbi:condensation domain-containing protein [Acuticoccus sp. M5D2P5]|uniref:condensation domain-containing protein n=1 Tax=Acuticoccus kalidii TaxID=2910977 RepID=UPI001F4870E2|nr:condensation domain-containing protein [Acuticoccus kalidii]MCF3935172.1 condensation domain-containing protein [Acuticoccus kalidii]
MTTPERDHPVEAPAPDSLGTFPLSAGQERCWFLDQLSPGNQALNVAIRWHVKGHVAAKSIEGAFRAVIARHEILRTRFVEKDGRPVQEVLTRADFVLSEIDMRGTRGPADEARVDEIALADAAKPFDLTKAPLIRAILIRLDAERAILAITIHQICFDGWSIRLLGREIGAFAAAIEAGRPAELPELPLQYADYALWQRDYLDSGAFQEDADYWRQKLGGMTYFELQPDFPRPLQRTTECGSVHADVPVTFGARIEEAAKARAMSPFAFGAAILSAMLGRLTGANDVIFATQVAGRIDVDIEALIGVFINNLVLRFDVPGERTFEDHLAHAKATVQDAVTHQSVPFNRLVEIINPARDPSRTPLVSVNLIQQNAFMETARYGGFELSSAPSHAPGAIYDLNFMVVGRPSGWRISIEYKSDLFRKETAETLLAMWRDTIAFALDHPDRPLADLPRPDGFGESGAPAGEIGRIEAALRAHPLVEDAAALAFAAHDGTAKRYAFVTPSDAATMPLETLPARLVKDLTRADAGTAPDGISVLKALPRDGTGRIARTRLTVPASALAPAAPSTAKGPAEDAVVRRLAAIWEEVLGVTGIGVTANFFDLGGHSLLSIRMLARVAEEFGVAPSLAATYRSPDLGALAGEIAALVRPAAAIDDAAADWRIVELSPAGPGVTIVWINHIGTVHALSRMSAGERRILCLRTFEPGREHGLKGLPMEKIAAIYVDLIRKAKVEGPIVLGGGCWHGVLAYEIAQQLKPLGIEVALLIGINMWHPALKARMSARQRWAMRFTDLGKNLAAVRAGEKSIVAAAGNYALPHKLGVFRTARALGLIREIPARTGLPDEDDFIVTLVAARDAYVPRAYDGAFMQILVPESPRGPGIDPLLGWVGLVKGPVETAEIRRNATSIEDDPDHPLGVEVVSQTLQEIDRRTGRRGTR